MDGETSSFSYFKGSCALLSHFYLFLSLLTRRWENISFQKDSFPQEIHKQAKLLSNKPQFSLFFISQVPASCVCEQWHPEGFLPATHPSHLTARTCTQPCPMLMHYLLVRVEAPSSGFFVSDPFSAADAGERPCHPPLLVSTEVENSGGMGKEGSGKAAEDELQEGGYQGEWVCPSAPQRCALGGDLLLYTCLTGLAMCW